MQNVTWLLYLYSYLSVQLILHTDDYITSLYMTCDLLFSANYLGIQTLLELCSVKIASSLLGKTPKQIRDIFGVYDEFTPEEEESLKKEFAEYLN